MDVTADQLADSVAALVRIPSVNPLHTGPRATAAGPIGERPIAEYLGSRFRELGATEVVLDEVLDGRPNVYGLFPGRTDRLVVIDVHTDTVTVEHMTDPPFDGRIEDGRVWGRGALDTKASLGVVTGAARGVAAARSAARADAARRRFDQRGGRRAARGEPVPAVGRTASARDRPDDRRRADPSWRRSTDTRAPRR